MTTGRKKMLLSNDDVHERAQFVKNYIQLKLQNNSKTIERSKEDMLTVQWPIAGLHIVSAYAPEFKPQLISNGAREIYEGSHQLIIIFCVFDVSRIWFRACKDRFRT